MRPTLGDLGTTFLALAAIVTGALVMGLPLMLAIVCLFGVPLALLRVSRQFFPADPQCDSLKALLSAIAVGVAIFWVLQGALSSRLQVTVDAHAFESGTSGHKLLVASVEISNEGSNDVSVESAKLLIVPKRNGKAIGKIEPAGTEELRLGPNKKDRWHFILSDEYCLAWGTTVNAQVSRFVPDAESYDLELEVYTHHKITGSLATWRASAALALGAEKGRSPGRASSPESKDKKGSVLERTIGVLKGE